MKTITRKYKVYKFEELSEKAKEKAINDFINLILENMDYEDMSPDMKRACDKANEMLTPWFTSSYIWDYCKEEIIEGFKLNNDLFLVDGSYFS